MRESRTYGSVRGALSNERPYRDRRFRSSQGRKLIRIQLFKQPHQDTTSHSRRLRARFARSTLPKSRRAQGRPGADCTRGPRATKSTGVGPQVNRSNAGLPCAMVLRLIARSPRRPGFSCRRRPAECCAGLDSSIGGSGPHAFAVRCRRHSPLARQRPSHPAPNVP